ncbi:MAG: hypothetical protein ABI769_15000 [Pseudomonadota bacterium]
MEDSVELQIRGSRAELGPDGIRLKPRYLRKSVLIPWNNVMYVSPVPTVRRDGKDWISFRGETMTPEVLGRSVQFYLVRVAVHDRHVVLSSCGFFARAVFRASFLLKPLQSGPNETVHADQGCFRLDFDRSWVRKNGAKLIAVLEIVEKHSGFNSLIAED